MSYLNRVWMAASVSVVNSSDQGGKLKNGINSLRHGSKCSFPAGSSVDPADLRPLSSVAGSDLAESYGEQRRKQANESLSQVMFLNCWAPAKQAATMNSSGEKIGDD